jgi:polyhydroxybutyrate depolymerase
MMLVAAGCGGGGDDSAANGDSNPAAATASTASSTSTSADPQDEGTRSAGCESPRPKPGESTVTITSGGEERTYLRLVPDAGSSSGGDETAAPLVLDFPAYSPAEMETEFSGLTKPDADGKVPADEFGAVVVTPEPVNGAGTLLTWNYVDTDGWTDDVRFVADMLDDVEAAACIDTDRVLATGFAVGGVFASIVTCELPDRIAVLATVSGLYNPQGCGADAAKAVVSFHGTGDRFIPFDGGIGSGPANLGLSAETTAGLTFMLDRPGALDSSTAWAERDGCEAKPVEKPAGDGAGPGVTRRVWPGCDDGLDVELFEIDGGEHTWPGSVGMAAYEGLLGPVSTEIDATAVMWDFFEAHA